MLCVSRAPESSRAVAMRPNPITLDPVGIDASLQRQTFASEQKKCCRCESFPLNRRLWQSSLHIDPRSSGPIVPGLTISIDRVPSSAAALRRLFVTVADARSRGKHK